MAVGLSDFIEGVRVKLAYHLNNFGTQAFEKPPTLIT